MDTVLDCLLGQEGGGARFPFLFPLKNPCKINPMRGVGAAQQRGVWGVRPQVSPDGSGKGENQNLSFNLIFFL